MYKQVPAVITVKWFRQHYPNLCKQMSEADLAEDLHRLNEHEIVSTLDLHYVTRPMLEDIGIDARLLEVIKPPVVQADRIDDLEQRVHVLESIVIRILRELQEEDPTAPSCTAYHKRAQAP